QPYTAILVPVCTPIQTSLFRPAPSATIVPAIVPVTLTPVSEPPPIVPVVPTLPNDVPLIVPEPALESSTAVIVPVSVPIEPPLSVDARRGGIELDLIDV